MKTLIKFFSLVFLVCALLYVFSDAVFAAKPQTRDTFTVLMVGFDESPSNTDVLCVLSCNSSLQTVRAIQLPRDTYFDYGGKKGKINGLYSYEILKGATNAEALSTLSDRISEALGIDIDGYIAFTSDGLIETIDFLGGVEIPIQDIPPKLKNEYNLSDKSNLSLSGKDSMSFVRYRKGYKRGDLERLDAQKIFLKAIFEKIKNTREIFSFLKFLSQNDGVFLNVDKGVIVSFLLGNGIAFGDLNFQIATLSGKAIKTDGTWYYVINKKEAEALVMEYFPKKHKAFDSRNYFIYI